MPRALPLAALAAVTALSVGLLGACTSTTSGTATPTGGVGQQDPPDGDPGAGPGDGTDPSGSASAPAPTVDIPPPPVELSLAGLEPCSLLTAAQVTELGAELGFDQPPAAKVRDDEQRTPYCSLEQSAEPFNSVDLLLVTTEGIEPWLSGERNVDAWLVAIDGFPAVSYKLKGTEDEECVTSVGVASGQQLTVDLQSLVDTDYRELCRITEQVATMATRTLRTLG